MNYPIELKRREVAAIRLRRAKAGVPAAAVAEEYERAEKEAQEKASPPGSGADALPPRTVALALSGGGIRCATFSLGILQALALKGRLRQVDVLSSVSGGGYAGSFLGRLFTRGAIARLAETEGGDPCGRVEEIVGDDNSPQLQWLRTHGNYILAAGGSDVREHLAFYWRNLSSIYLVLTFLGLAVFGLLRLGGYLLQRWAPGFLRTPPFAMAFGGWLAECWSVWWWLPVAVFALAVAPLTIAFWLTPKQDTRASFSFFPITGWAVLLAGLALASAHAGGVPGVLLPAVILVLAAVCLELARLSLPKHLDAATGETSADPGTVIRNRLNWALGEAQVVLVVTLLWAILDTVARAVALNKLQTFILSWSALIAPLLPFLQDVAERLGQEGPDRDPGRAKRTSLFSSPHFHAGLIAFPIAGLLLVLLDAAVHWLFNLDRAWGCFAATAGVVLSIIFGRAFDFLNYSALSAAYAARLSRTFLGASNPARFRAASNEPGRDVQVTHPDDDLAFADYHPEANGGPLHLIGLCVNETVDAFSQRDIRDRKGLPMCVSPCGVSVGRRFHALWADPPPFHDLPLGARLQRLLDGRRTLEPNTALEAIPTGEVFHVLKGKTDQPVVVESLRLGTWIATSGAAFGTGAGRATSLPISLLHGLVDLRLGYWWDSGLDSDDRPGRYPWNLWRWLKHAPAFFVKMQSLLLADFKGRFPGPARRFWNISDGGHFDVTGLYELLRRRVPFIVAVDGGQDDQLTFSDLGELVRQARIDLDAEVTFLDETKFTPDAATGLAAAGVPPWMLGWLNPAALGPLSEIGEKGGKHAALAQVTYGRDLTPATWILVLKASITGDEPRDIAAYKLAHDDFPGESTYQQFFDEAQWESYRKLGEHIGSTVLR